MRWLLLKDLQILRRSPLLVALLVAYPVLVSLLIGFAISGGPDKPTVAFYNGVAPGESTFSVGGEERDAADFADQFFDAVEPIRVDSREEAIEKVRSGDALGALIVPADAAAKLRDSLSLAGAPQRPTVEVIYNGEDPVKRRFVESTIEARLAEANQALSGEITKIGADYLVLPKGGKNIEEGMKLIAYITSAENNARLSKYIPYAPPNEKAVGKADPSKKKDLPTTHNDVALFFDDQWWGENFAEVDKQFQSWLQA